MNKALLLGVLVSLACVSQAKADAVSEIKNLLSPNVSTRSIKGRGAFAGVVQYRGGTCSGIPIGQSFASSFVFSGYGASGAAQYRGISFRGPVSGLTFRGTGSNASLLGAMLTRFSGAGSRLTRAAVALRFVPRGYSCYIDLSGSFGAR